MRIRPTLLILLATLQFASVARAEDLTAEKMADIRTLFELTGVVRMADQILASTLQQLGPNLRSCKDCTERTAQIAEREIRQLFRERFDGPGGLIERQAGIYHRHFSHAEIRELLSFYRSPIGSKLAHNLPALTAEGMQSGREWAQSLAPELQRRIKAAIELDSMLTPPALPGAK